MQKTISESQFKDFCLILDKNVSKTRKLSVTNRNPVHVIYGGAHLFKSDTVQKLGRIALKTFETFAPDAKSFGETFGFNDELSNKIFERVREKLMREPIEDLRVDFEDGYGFRSNEEEDSHAVSASDEMAKALHTNTLPPFCGFRIKSFSPETYKRAIMTLDLFLTNLLEKTDAKLPENFVLTLPKVENETQIKVLATLLKEFENRFGLEKNSLKLEILIETPSAIFNEKGKVPLKKFIKAADNRCVAAHFGAYDFTSSFGIAAEHQHLNHKLCDFARNVMQTSLAETGVRLSDSVTTLLPVAVHKGETLSRQQFDENSFAMRTAWREHFANVTNSMRNGFYQSWDLHPNQFVARYAAVYSFFIGDSESSAKRLRGFLGKATQAITTGNQFDDAASANGLLNFFNRAFSCGAIPADEIEISTNLSIEELRLNSFAKIMEKRGKSS
ncbi:MAG: phosphoenolpyruvate kinase [Pyrinomonadaceae bacterium]|nr:phosphoenolpyruvate kinase [Pyrinomonadaceae bacterium]